MNGGTPSKSVPSYFEGDIPWITGADILGTVVNSARSFITEEGIKNSATNRVPSGTVLLVTRTSVGKVAVAGMELCYSQDITALKPDLSKLDVAYLVQFLRFKESYLKRQSRGATIKGVTKAVLESLEIPLPPIAQQKRIAAILDRAEELRSLRRQALGALDAIAQSIFLEMFGNPTDNPHQFPIKRLIEIVDPNRPISYGILMPGADQDSGVLYVRVVDMKDGGIELANIRRTTPEISNAYRRSLLKPYDVLLSIRGHVGRLAIVPSALNAANITQDTARLAIKDAEPTFVCECLRTASFQRWMVKHTKGVAVRGINLGDVKQMPIILPPLNLQQEFARRVEAIEQLKTTHRESLAQLDALFASLQHRAFRGELSP